jgi:transcription-repair coupling factor (superfamily II helicase)
LAYEPQSLHQDIDDYLKTTSSRLWTTLNSVGQSYKVTTFETLKSKLNYQKTFLPLADEIRELKSKELSVEIVIKGDRRRQAITEFLDSSASLADWSTGPLFQGFASPTFSKAFITEGDIFGVKRKRSSTAKKTKDEFLRQFSDMNPGDYVIHDDHGISRYHGLQKLSANNVTGEFIVLEYAGNDKLYLPIYRLDKISRYVRDGHAKPRLDRLGAQVFQKKKARIRKDILRMAHELLKTAAERRLNKIERFPIDREMYSNFCEEFPYEMTPDQESASEDIEKDFENDFPIDRLVCGDVGFGKTEVALRAAVISLLQGKQVAILAPTTLLVEQHYNTFHKRFKNFPFEVAHLSRFVNATDQKKIVQKTKEGKIDLLIGTHRLIQSDVDFKNLGLLIVDEEQRFGVKHKEKIKKLRSALDVVTLSATPIPRTLHMAMSGIRELSLITTAPDSREAVRTFVGAFDNKLVREACLKERERGGQVIIIHNRVQTIDSFAAKLKKLIPECRFVIAHGQMAEGVLEKKMHEFIENKADILVATTIVENGLDIPNANTLIVDRSDMFGLSSLYQIRGRVGRSNRSAFAYFLIRDEVPLTEEASKRLQVLQSCTELGSGFTIATHDMEIRGSGNLLGEKQSGAIAEIGLELYQQLLEETLAEIKKEGIAEPLPEVNSGYTAYIPETYIPDTSIRIATYKRLDRVKSPQELFEAEEELLDRFGLYPKEVENLCQILRLRTIAYSLQAKTIDCFPGRLSLSLSDSTPLSPEKLIPFLGKKMTIDPKGRLSMQFKSAMHDSNLAKGPKFEKHPELYDFEQCRQQLLKLSEIAEIQLKAI